MFLELILQRDPLKAHFENPHSARVSTCCEHVWSDGKSLLTPNTYSLPENFKKTMGLTNKGIIMPYPISFIRNPQFDGLIRIIDVLTNALIPVTDPVIISAQARNVRSLSLLMKKNVAALNMYFINNSENLDRMSSIPITDNVCNVEFPYYVERQVFLSDFISCFVYPNKNVMDKGPNMLYGIIQKERNKYGYKSI